MIKIVTDSSVDFTPEMARDLDVTVVPLSITFGDKSYLDGSDIDAATLYRMLRDEHAHPRTAQPSVGLFEEAFRRLAAEGHDIVVITLASALSGTYNSAALAARNVPEARVTLIDSHGISMAMGSMVIDAVHMAREGKTAAEIEAAVQALIPRLELLLMCDTLTYLQRGGRIGRASSFVGSMLNIKPIISLRDGQVVPVQRVRTRGKALQEMATMAKAVAPFEQVYIMHTTAPELAAEFAAMVRSVYDGDIPIMMLGPVVGVHLGPGSVGITGLRSRES